MAGWTKQDFVLPVSGNHCHEIMIMDNKSLFFTGAIGTALAAICCFTPALVIVLAAMGLSAWLGWLDYVLLPALGVFAVITVLAAVRWWLDVRSTSKS